MDAQSPPVVAAFDLDGTLTEGGSVFPWLKSIAGRGRTWRASLSLAIPLTIGAIRSMAGKTSSRTFASTSRYGPAGFTITMSAPC